MGHRFFPFPQLFLFAAPGVRRLRGVVADAHVGPARVVKVDVPADDLAGRGDVGESAAAVYGLLLYYAVDALGHGVVGGVVVLGHAHRYAVSPQLADVGVAAVLHPAVGVVDEAVKTVRAAHRHGMGYGLPEGLERLRGAQRRRDLVAYDLVRVGIGDYVQVARATAFEWYIGYVGHPQLVRGGGREAAHEVLPLVVAVVGVGRAAGLRTRQHETTPAEQAEEAVAAGHPFTTEDRAEHQPRLAAAYARGLRAYGIHLLQYAAPAQGGLHPAGPQPVVGLAAAAKQTARGRDFHAASADQFRHCLAPCFFLMDISYSRSAMSIITSRASVSKREYASAFSNSRTRLRRAAFSSL